MSWSRPEISRSIFFGVHCGLSAVRDYWSGKKRDPIATTISFKSIIESSWFLKKVDNWNWILNITLLLARFTSRGYTLASGVYALGVPYKIFGVVHPAQFFIPKHGTSYHDEILLKITRVWYNSLAWYTLCADNLTVLEKSVVPFFVVLIFFVFLVFRGFSGVQGLEDDFVKICGVGMEMVTGELDSTLATTFRCIPSAQTELAYVCAQLFVHRVCAQLFVQQSLQTTGCKNRARWFLKKCLNLESQASELGKTDERKDFNLILRIHVHVLIFSVEELLASLYILKVDSGSFQAGIGKPPEPRTW